MTTRRILGTFASGDLQGLRAATRRPTLSKAIGASDTASRARQVIVAVLAAAILAWSSIPVANGAEPGPQAVVQSFYDWYIAEAEAGRPLTLRGRPDLTPAFVDWAEHYNDGQMFGADPVLCAQAIPDSVTAGAATISGTKATVPVTEDFGDPYTITVGLTLGSAGWQISTGGCAQASPAVARKPDGRIRRGTYGYPGKTKSDHAAFVGNNIYNTTGARQKAVVESFNEPEGAFYTFDISIQNDRTRADRFKVKATGAATRGGWKVAYFHGTTNITAAIVAGTFRTASLAPGASYLIVAKLTQGSETTTRLVTIRSVADPTKVDAVKFGYKRGACGC